MNVDAAELSGRLVETGVRRGDSIGLAAATIAGSISVALVIDDHKLPWIVHPPIAALGDVDTNLRPRWVVWSPTTSALLLRAGFRPATCWDIAAAHRMMYGGWRAEPADVWAYLNGLPVESMPSVGPLDLFSSIEEAGDPDDPVRPDGFLRPQWSAADFEWSNERLGRWAKLAFEIAARQLIAFSERRDADLHDDPAPARAVASVRSESTTELLCNELAADGLPLDRTVAEQIIESLVGPRPLNDSDATRQRRERDNEVLRLAPRGTEFDLRNPAQVKSLLRSVGVETPDTRAWRLEAIRGSHPLIDALLTWRRAERVSTTFGYTWLDEHLGPDSRLRGEWTACDGAAGRMTASAGLHNMPSLMRPAVIAEPGHVFVRADLGQIEPRILAAVSGDPILAKATADDDLYLPVAAALGVDRATAKVAVLGAMYGQTTGHGASALRRLEATYPVAMSYLLQADLAGQARRDLRTYGGRVIRMGSSSTSDPDAMPSASDERSRAAARGRFGRNAMVQGPAAELFKVWALTVRARAAAFDASIVLCLHDELLVHAPLEHADKVNDVVVDSLAEAAFRWAPNDSVRFVVDCGMVDRWSDAKA